MISEPTSDGWARARLTSKQFAHLGAIIEERCGIQMPPSKKAMAEARLRRRLRELGLMSFAEYCEYISGNNGRRELVHMVDAITVNKTDFFRESRHFDYLTQVVVPGLIREARGFTNLNLKVWSAGCATGEEPYTIAMVLSELALQTPGLRFDILASDICTEALTDAQKAIFAPERVAPVPDHLRRKYLLQSRDRTRPLVRVAPNIRRTVRFCELNLVEPHYALQEPLNIIFCRNVFIYFARDTQQAILERFCRYLAPGGYVFLGHSDTITGLNTPSCRLLQQSIANRRVTSGGEKVGRGTTCASAHR